MMGRKFKTQFDKRPVKDGVYPCDEILPGDGIDPRYETEEPRRVPNRKALQLCSQVFDALNLILSACSDNWLQQLHVGSIVPAPDSTQLLVTVVAPDDMALDEALDKIQLAYGMIRSEVARSINRKRVPQLKFVVKRGV
jgi:ribosome-binding factor A